MRKFKKLLLALTIFQACSGNEVNNKNSETSTQKTVDEYESRFKERSKIFYDSNKHLSIVFFQDSLKADFITTSIPDESDLSIKLCIPAAFSCGDYI
ncbi:MAG: hypothetical protein LH606_10675, partial [Cytophagaceae bacterium]|nr:hypothetical protein [Cytophagaceae bacterium]